MSICFNCDKVIDKENEPSSSLKCAICIESFHPSCVGLTKTFLKTLIPYKNFSWTCDVCMPKHDFQLNVLKRLSDVEKLLKSQDENRQSDQKEMADLKATIQSHLSKCDSTFLKTLVPVGVTPQSTKHKRKWSDVVSSNSPTPVSTNKVAFNNASAAKRLKSSVDIAPVKRDPILIVRANGTAEKSKVKDAVKSALNPLSDPVKNLRETAKGDVVLVCNDEQSIEAVKKKICDTLGQLVEVNEPKMATPTVKVVGFDADLCNDHAQLMQTMKSQNVDLFDEASMIKVTDTKKRRDGQSGSAILQLDLLSFKKVMKLQRVSIGWNRCRVYEQLNVLRCYKCNEYGHIAKDCTSESYVCALCTGNHKLEECQSKELKCVNCVKARVNLNINIDVNHSAFSSKCPILSKRTEQRKRNIRYES